MSIALPQKLYFMEGQRVSMDLRQLTDRLGGHWEARASSVDGKFTGRLMSDPYRYDWFETSSYDKDTGVGLDPLKHPDPFPVTDHRIVFGLMDDHLRRVRQVRSEMTVFPLDAVTGQTVRIILIGDSTEQNGLAAKALLDAAAAIGLTIEFVGPQTVEVDGVTIRHAAYGGCDWNEIRRQEYINGNVDPSRFNAFYNPATGDFDYPQYEAAAAHGPVDLAIVTFGNNNAAVLLEESEVAEALPVVYSDAKAVVASILSVRSTMRVILKTSPMNLDFSGAAKPFGLSRSGPDQFRAVSQINNELVGLDGYQDRTRLAPTGAFVDPETAFETINVDGRDIPDNLVHYSGPGGYANVGVATLPWVVAAMLETDAAAA